MVYVKRVPSNEPVISIKHKSTLSISDIVREDLKEVKLLIGVFMSPLDVHYNRAPLSGEIEVIRHHAAQWKNHHMGSMHWRSIVRRFPIYENSLHLIGNERTVTKIRGTYRREEVACYVVQIAGGSVRGIDSYLPVGGRISKGVREKKVMFYSSGIDVGLFHPSKRNGFLKNRYGVSEQEIKILYVGRVSREKNMPLLSEVYRKLVSEKSGLRLIVVGNGPYLEEMKSSMKNLPVTFTGFLTGEDLAQAYASSDIFVFPSTTDTFGNVVLEAQASGLPVIVTDEGGPKENILPGKTGIIVPGQEKEAFVQAILRLVDDPKQLERMKLAAREHIEHRTFDAAFLKLWESYRSVDPYRTSEGGRQTLLPHFEDRHNIRPGQGRP